MSKGTKDDKGKSPARYFYWEPYAVLSARPERELIAMMDDLILALVQNNRDRAGAILMRLSMILSMQLAEEMDHVLEKVADVSSLGAKKYGIFNYKKGMKWSRLVDACGRHFLAFLQGTKKDEESGVDHRIHMLANIYMLGYYIKKDVGQNDLVEEKQ